MIFRYFQTVFSFTFTFFFYSLLILLITHPSSIVVNFKRKLGTIHWAFFSIFSILYFYLVYDLIFKNLRIKTLWKKYFIIFKFQGKHAKSVQETTIVDFNQLFRNSVCCNTKILKLIILVLHPRAEVPILTIDKNSCLDLYLKVHDLGLEDTYPQAYTCLLLLFNTYKFLVYSSVSITCIRQQCSKINLQCSPEFVNFLILWLMKMGHLAFYLVPFQEILDCFKCQPNCKKVRTVFVNTFNTRKIDQ